MDWIENLNRAIAYMEEHMTEDIDYAQVAKIACCSSYHFQRMFTYIAGVPLHHQQRLTVPLKAYTTLHLHTLCISNR